MNFPAPIVLVTVVFAAQILVLSVLVPYQWHRTYSRLKERYPPRDYPRLYPVPAGKVERFNTILTVLRIVIAVAGTAIFAVDLAEGRDPDELAQTMMWVALAQAVPALVWVPWQLRMARAFRAMPAPSVRSAELRPSRLGDFVPLPLVAAGIAGSVISLVSAIALYRTDPGRLRVVAVFVLPYSGWLLVRMLIAMRAPGSAPRPDPYMTDADVFRARQVRLRVLFTVGGVVGAGVTLILFFQAGRLPVDILAIRMGSSILYQVVLLGTTRVVLRTLAVRDTSVYRTEAT